MNSKDETNNKLSPHTIAVAAGRPPRTAGSPVNPAIVLSSTYHSTAIPNENEKLYTRLGTETWEPFEDAVAQLETAQLPGVLFSSGMASIAAVFALVPAGGKIVIARHSYQMALGLADELAERFNIEIVRVNIENTAETIASFNGANLVWVESPTNPMLEVGDLPALIEGAHQVGALIGVDNTFATPLLQQPLNLGADIVIHSATKSLAGHSDVVLGIALTNDATLHTHLTKYRGTHGAIAGPFEAWLALRGLRTLGVRVAAAGANAQYLAEQLQAHEATVEVRYPGLSTDAGHELAKKQMSGFGSIIGLRPIGGKEGAQKLVESLQLWTPATSLGGVESTLERRRRFTSESVSVPEDLIRLSVGVEAKEDLWQDLLQGLAQLG